MVPTTVALMLVSSTKSQPQKETPRWSTVSVTTVADVVAQVRDGRLEDFVREAVVLAARKFDAPGSPAELGELTPEARRPSRRVTAAGVGVEDEGR